MNIIDINKFDVDFVINELKKGKIFVIPTDTSYGLVGKVDERTVSRIFKIKKRSKEKSFTVFLNKEIIKELVVTDNRDKSLINKFWPGALTLILKPKTDKINFFDSILDSRGTIAVREPDNTMVLEVLENYRLPITATSANISKKPPAYSTKEVTDYFCKSPSPDYFINSGTLSKNPVSTIIDLEDDLRIIRKGRIKKEEIKEVLEML